jgi:hypothetical protein
MDFDPRDFDSRDDDRLRSIDIVEAAVAPTMTSIAVTI